MTHMVEGYAKRTCRRCREDGLAEIATALLMAAAGSVLLSREQAASSPLKTAILIAVLPTLITGGSSLVRRFADAVKECVTFAPMGYVSCRRGQPLVSAAGPARGHLASHLTRLERTGCVRIEKSFAGEQLVRCAQWQGKKTAWSTVVKADEGRLLRQVPISSVI